MRIGLTQRVEVVADYGERRDCLDQAWTRLLGRHGLTPLPLCNAVGDVAEDVTSYVAGLALDGIILTGGNDLCDLPGATHTAPERDAFERSLLELAAASDLPVLGVCRGMQMMVAADGGALVPVAGHVATRHAVAGPVAGPVAAAAASHATIRRLMDRESVNSFHNFGVPADGLGPSWRAVALAPDGTVEAMVHRRPRQWAIMWHPERAPHDERDAELLLNLFRKRTP